MKKKTSLQVAIALLIATLSTQNLMAQRPLGVDVSTYQGTGINWSSVHNSGKTFAWAKATESTTITDNTFVGNENNGKAAGMYMGAYHFAHPNLHAPATEAAYFWGVAGGYIKADGKTLMPMLDMEVFSGVTGASSYSDWANQWNNTIVNDAHAAGVNVRPAIYTSACSACNFNSSVATWLSDIADYNGQNPQTGTPWSTCGSCAVWGSGVWNAWQYSSTGSVPGISGNVDSDVFNGNASQLVLAFVATSVNGGNGQEGWYSQPVANNLSGPLEMVAIGTDSNVYHDWETSPGGTTWSGWYSLAGAGTTPGAVMARNADGRMQFFVRGSGNVIWTQYQTTPGGGWSGWGNLPGLAALTEPVVGVDSDGGLEVIVVGSDTAVWHNYQLGANGAWSGWYSLAGPGTQQVTVGRNADGRLEIFTWGGNGAIWHNSQVAPTGQWAGWVSLGGSLIGKPAVGANSNGALELWAVGTDHQFWHNYQIGAGGTWSGWSAMGGAGQTDPNITMARNQDGRLEVYAIGADTAVWHNYQLTPTGSWAGWGSFGGAGSFSPIAAARNSDGRLQFFVRGSGNSIWFQYQTSAGGGWSGWGSLGGSLAGL